MNTKRLSLALALLALCGVACNRAKPVPSPTTHSLREGGISGGGGGTLPAQPSTTAEIAQIVRNSKRDVRLLSNYYDGAYYSGLNAPGLKAKLYDGPRTLRDVI